MSGLKCCLINYVVIDCTVTKTFGYVKACTNIRYV